MRMSLKTKLILFVGSILVLVVFLMWWIGFKQSRTMLREEVEKRGRILASNLASNSIAGIERENLFSELNPLVQGLLAEPDVGYVFIENAEGVVLADEDHGNIRSILGTIRDRQENSRQGISVIYYNSEQGSQWCSIRKAVDRKETERESLDDNQILGYVGLGE